MHDKVLKVEQFFIDSRTISISHRVPLDSSLRCAVELSDHDIWLKC